MTVNCSINLREYQFDSVDRLRDGFRKGNRKLILAAPTGYGKTEVGAYLIALNQAKASTAWFVVDRVPLVKQTSERFDRYGIDHGIIQADHERTDYAKPVQIVSAQTLARRSIRKTPNLLIVDEAHCFSPGTLISTPSGGKPIEEIQEGEPVFNAAGIGYVLHTFFRPVTGLMATVEFEDGTSIRCTADHRFFAGGAWREARFLDGQSVLGIEDMPGMWADFSSAYQQSRKGQLAGRTRGILAQAEVLLAELCEDVKKPYAQRPGSRENGRNAGIDKVHASNSGWEWSRNDGSATGAISETWSELAPRICCENGASRSGRVSSPLQDRSCEPRNDGGDRDRWQEPSVRKSERAGPEEGRIARGKRVVRVQIEQRRSNEAVYNLHVSGHPSYFANGRLAHNCQYKAVLDLMDELTGTTVIGLTATPFTAGMADHWDGVVNGTTVNKLLEMGFLSPLKIKACVTPDMKGVKKKFNGEYDEEDSGQRGIVIVGDVVSTWVEQTRKFFGGPVKTIVFSPSVAHGAELCRQFAEAGYNFQQISYLDGGDSVRDEKIDEFRKPDSRIHGLISCAVLTKGFDVPDVMCGISCRPYAKSFSSHVQEMGRVMRTHPGKEFGLWLDHSGNAVSFAGDTAWLYEYGVDSLSDAQKRDSEQREPSERVKQKYFCGECGLQLEPTCTSCPACGWERPKRGEIQIVQGELIDFDMSSAASFRPRQGLRAECLKDPKAVWNAALAYCLSKSRKGEDAARKWAYGVWRSIYPDSRLPMGLFDAPCVPEAVSSGEWGLIDREISRFRKSRGRRAA